MLNILTLFDRNLPGTNVFSEDCRYNHAITNCLDLVALQPRSTRGRRQFDRAKNLDQFKRHALMNAIEWAWIMHLIYNNYVYYIIILLSCLLTVTASFLLYDFFLRPVLGPLFKITTSFVRNYYRSPHPSKNVKAASSFPKRGVLYRSTTRSWITTPCLTSFWRYKSCINPFFATGFSPP